MPKGYIRRSYNMFSMKFGYNQITLKLTILWGTIEGVGTHNKRC